MITANSPNFSRKAKNWNSHHFSNFASNLTWDESLEFFISSINCKNRALLKFKQKEKIPREWLTKSCIKFDAIFKNLFNLSTLITKVRRIDGILFYGKHFFYSTENIRENLRCSFLGEKIDKTCRHVILGKIFAPSLHSRMLRRKFLQRANKTLLIPTNTLINRGRKITVNEIYRAEFFTPWNIYKFLQ